MTDTGLEAGQTKGRSEADTVPLLAGTNQGRKSSQNPLGSLSWCRSMKRAGKSGWQLAARLKIVCSPPRASERSKQEEDGCACRSEREEAQGGSRPQWFTSYLRVSIAVMLGRKRSVWFTHHSPPLRRAMAGTQTGHDLEAGADAEALKPPACSACILVESRVTNPEVSPTTKSCTTPCLCEPLIKKMPTV